MKSFMAAVLLTLAGPVLAATPPAFSSGEQFNERSGEDLFHAICQGCHMPDALGAHGAGAYPALAANPKLAAAAYPVYVVSHGQGGMPSFREYLDDEQIASVVNYVRSHFDNHFNDNVSAADVKKISQP
ncbi:c-type cytochrome [Pseudomonas sp. TE3610]